jgi:hypothetical protein
MTPMTPAPAKTQPIVSLILHLSMLSAVVVYIVLGLILGKNIPRNPNTIVMMTLGVIALLSVPLGLFVPAFIASRDRSAMARTNACIQRTVVSDAIFEMGGVLGLVGILIGMPFWFGYTLMGLSLALLMGNTLRVTGWMQDAQE